MGFYLCIILFLIGLPGSTKTLEGSVYCSNVKLQKQTPKVDNSYRPVTKFNVKIEKNPGIYGFMHSGFFLPALVVKVYPGTPAALAGLQVNDYILRTDDPTAVCDKVAYVGLAGEIVHMKIRKPTGEIKYITIKRENINKFPQLFKEYNYTK